MTRAPLPGKLPEWPVDAHVIYGSEHLEAVRVEAIIAYWESRARLAWKALDRASELLHQGYADDSEKIDEAILPIDQALDMIGPLPEEDRT